jgi:CheY-like chemotaxis protein
MSPTAPVLIVDDDPAIRAVPAETLIDEGYRTLTGPYGAAALAALQDASPPCLIVLDLMMPVMDGFAFRAVQRRTPHLAPIPVVVLSAFPATVETAAELDVAAYLSKPVPLDQLVATVARSCAAPS